MPTAQKVVAGASLPNTLLSPCFGYNKQALIFMVQPTERTSERASAQRSRRQFTRKRGAVVDFHRISYVIGMMLLVLTVFMVPPALTDVLAGNPDFWVFVGSAFVTGFLGLMMVMSSRGSWSEEIYLKEGFVLTVASWIALVYGRHHSLCFLWPRPQPDRCLV